jgi:ubiquinone/menaquinone biosynthesis C-methylase UbiE
MLNAVRRRLPLGIRADAVELLDSGCLSLPEVEANLADLARLNRLPGGTTASIAGIERLVGAGNAARILDVGTGRGDMPLAFAARGWDAVAVDANPDVLVVARRELGRREIDVVEADVRALPFDDGAFDVAHASLLLHHLDPAAAVAGLRELRRVARRGVVVNDLRRGWVPLVASAVSVALFARSRVTRSDGLASARRAYTLDELDGLLGDAGLSRRWRSRAWMPRVVTAASS